MAEKMVVVKWPNGYITEMLAPLAALHIKAKQVVPATKDELSVYRGLTAPKPPAKSPKPVLENDEAGAAEEK